METKELYQAPVAQTVEVSAETLICQSDPANVTGNRQDYDNPIPLEW